MFRFSDTLIACAHLWAVPGRLRAIVAHAGLFPLRPAPGMAAFMVAPARVGRSDAGPFDAVAVTVPVSVGRPRLPLLGGFERLPATHPFFLAALLLSTDEACAAADAAGLPAARADIRMELDGRCLRCRVAQEEREVLRLEGHRREVSPAGDSAMATAPPRGVSGRLLSTRGDRLQEWEWSLGPAMRAGSPRDCPPRLTFGPHPLGRLLQAARLGGAGRLDYITVATGGLLASG